MSETPIMMQCFPVNNNIETFVSEDLLIPTAKDVVELNRFLLETNLNDTSTNAMDQIPYNAGPTNVIQPNSKEMQVLMPHTLPDPIRISLPDGVVPDGPFILLDMPLKDSSINKCKQTKTPEEIITPDLLNQAQNINHISVENGLKPIPVLSANNIIQNNSNNQVNDSPPIVVEMPYQLPLYSNSSLAEEDPGEDYEPIKFKVSKGFKRTAFKKVLLWVSIALVIYLIVLLFKKKL
jgi:hypothetical protein